METSLKTGFAQIFPCCPQNLSCSNFEGAVTPGYLHERFQYRTKTQQRVTRQNKDLACSADVFWVGETLIVFVILL